MTYEQLGEFAGELAEEDEEIKRVRHYFIEQFWRRMPQKMPAPDEIGEGEVVGAAHNDKPLLFAKVQGVIYALSDKCPHRGFPLHHKGKLNGYTLTCAYHGGRFDIRTGACMRHPTESSPCEVFATQVGADGEIVCRSVKKN
jgi:nitrite reductase/ring-hydroxylating ferredoxin subunit